MVEHGHLNEAHVSHRLQNAGRGEGGITFFFPGRCTPKNLSAGNRGWETKVPRSGPNCQINTFCGIIQHNKWYCTSWLCPILLLHKLLCYIHSPRTAQQSSKAHQIVWSVSPLIVYQCDVSSVAAPNHSGHSRTMMSHCLFADFSPCHCVSTRASCFLSTPVFPLHNAKRLHLLRHSTNLP